MEETIKISRKEKRHYLGYLIVLYLGAAILFSWILFMGVANPFSSATDAEREQLKQARLYDDKQVESLGIYDTVMRKIAVLKNSPGDQVLEADIENKINYLNSLNDGLPNQDMRSISFYQMAKYLKKHYGNAKIVRKKADNIQIFQSQLDQCSMSYNQTEQYMNQIKAAQSGR